MKYNDNGTVKNIVVKAGDTLPIGTIVDYDGTTVPDGYTVVEDKGEIYSTDKVRIGTWIDGKPLYRKVLGPVQLPNNNTISIQTGEYSDCLIKKVSACYDYSSLSSSLPQYIPVIPFNDGSKRCNMTYSEYQINITTNYDASAYKVYAIIEYTSKND